MKRTFSILISTILLSACAVCGFTACTHSHTFAEEWSYDGEYHWHEATCGHDSEIVKYPHDFDKDECSVCSYKKGDEPVVEKMKFTLNGNGYVMTASGSLPSDGIIEIPADYNGKYVTGIGSNAFHYKVKKVIIPATVTSINEKAFYYCSWLEAIEVASSNPNYKSQNGILYNKSLTQFVHIPRELKGNVVIPKGITDIPESAFRYCTLSGLTISDGVNGVIWENAFGACRYLTTVDIGNGVQGIRRNAFDGCDNLTKVTLGKGLKVIFDYAFVNCNKLQDIYYNGKKSKWNSVQKPDDWDNGFSYHGYTVHCSDGNITVDKKY